MKPEKGEKTMRRHVENQAGERERDVLGIIALFVMWALALMVLSAAAHGEEKQEQPPIAAAEKPSEIEKTPATEVKTDGRETVQHRLPVEQTKAKSTAAPQSNTDDQITLTRFILISIPDRQLAFVDDGEVVKVYPIAVGARHTPSTEGNFTIISHVANPTWSHKGNVVGPGKGNPVGSRWMGLSLKGYGIHGTNAPRSIGKAASHGCFRMGKKDVEELFKLVRVGDTVAVRAERDELVAQVFGGANNNGQVQLALAPATPADGDGE